MDDVIGFILSHLFQVVVVLFFASAIWTKVRGVFRGDSAGEQRPVNRMPSFGGGPDEARWRTGTMEKPKPHADPARLEEERRKAREELERKSAEEQRVYRHRTPDLSGEGISMEHPDLPMKTSHAAASRSSTSVPSGLPVQAQSSSLSLETEAGAVKEDDLVRGIIWAEILGPPRAKRPHRRG